MPKLTVKEAKLVQAKAKGLTHKQAAEAAGYSMRGKDTSIISTAGQTLNKPHVKEALNIALIKHGIDLDSSIAPIGKALHAMKQNEFTGEITEDIKTQLMGSDRALKLMGIGQDRDNGSTNFIQIINEKGSRYNI